MPILSFQNKCQNLKKKKDNYVVFADYYYNIILLSELHTLMQTGRERTGIQTDAKRCTVCKALESHCTLENTKTHELQGCFVSQMATFGN